MPSLPPSSWMTTRTRPSRCGSAARAVWARKLGMVGVRASRGEVLRKSRGVEVRGIARVWLWVGGAVFGVALVGEGDDGVDAVVAAVELDDDQDAAVALRLGGAGSLGQEAGDGGSQGEQGRSLEKIAACQGHGNLPV